MWQCRKCHSKIEDSFDVCWNCGTTKEGVEDPDFQPADTRDGTTAGDAEEMELSAVPSAKSDPSARAHHGTATGHLLARLLVLVLRVLAVVVFVWGVIILSKMIAAGIERAQTEALFTTGIMFVTAATVLAALAEALRIFIIIEANTRGAQTPHLRERGKRRHQ